MTSRLSPPTFQDHVEGIVQFIKYENDDQHYRVWEIQTQDGTTVTVAGQLQHVSEGTRVRVTGGWQINPRFGKQFRADAALELDPNTLHGIEQYLSSGILPGIGARFAARIVQRFGDQTLHVLDTTPERILEIKGIGKKRFPAIIQAWQEQRAVRNVMVFLQTHGVSAALAARVYRSLGSDTIRKVSENPYCLASIVGGIGFATADKIARSIGISPACPSRIHAAVLYALQQMQDDGHVFATRAQLVAETAKITGLAPDLIDPAIDDGSNVELRTEHIEPYGQVVYHSELFIEESALATNLARLATTSTAVLPHVDAAILAFEQSTGVNLAEEQRKAVQTAASVPMLILTGGPGVGKTTLLRALLNLYDAAGLTVKLAAPTGRAAKQMSDATATTSSAAKPASTLHRLLEFDPRHGTFLRNEKNPLQADVIVVDEASMLDQSLALSLVRAIQPGTRVVFVGDVDQLPSIGPGSVLGDLIASKIAPCVRLTKVFRQAAQSRIITNAHRIRTGYPPEAPQKNDVTSDFYVVGCPNAEAVQKSVLSLVCERITRVFGFAAETIQVLAPMHRGPAGTQTLNSLLQQRLNPHGQHTDVRAFRVGDKVMQLRNDYDRDVFNGDTGRVIGWDGTEQKLLVSFDGRRVSYERSQCDQLALNYACTIHKSQGSEYPAVVVALTMGGYLMLSRNLLYTAVTRGKKLVVLVAEPKAVSVAVSQYRQHERNTNLANKLVKMRNEGWGSELL